MGGAEIWELSFRVQLDISRVAAANDWDIDLNTRSEIPHLQGTLYYLVYFINILLTRKSRLNSRFKMRTRCYSFLLLNRAGDLPAAQTYRKKYFNCSRVVLRFFSVVELTNRFPIAVRLFSNRSQMTSKCGKNKKVAHEAQLCLANNCDWFKFKIQKKKNLNRELSSSVSVH